MNIYRTDSFPFPLPEGHRFPLGKYRMLAQRLVEDGIVTGKEMLVPREATREDLLRVHSPDYIQRLEQGEMTAKEMRRIGLPWSVELVERARRSVGATIESCVDASNSGIAVSLSGGTHHAFPDRGEGYCLFNDVAVAARTIQSAGGWTASLLSMPMFIRETARRLFSATIPRSLPFPSTEKTIFRFISRPAIWT